ncbi:hypothetical protein HPB47_003872 [Ixodes persulcatus]|uniref:Uncharacterized protein n=1 Tax=Ixodes persulcatus TaxID=34615 RepID=A0AC60PH89_IXOPE|nr:hypothetical protein HPB47_003872 [Ixodes persulcatus]
MPPVCGICLEGLRCQALVAPACGHVFHQQCLRIWGEDSLCCPLCRTTVHPGDLRRIFLSEKPRIRARKNSEWRCYWQGACADFGLFVTSVSAHMFFNDGRGPTLNQGTCLPDYPMYRFF